MEEEDVLSEAEQLIAEARDWKDADRPGNPTGAQMVARLADGMVRLLNLFAAKTSHRSKQPDGGDWQPIESAPRDGQPLVVGWHHPRTGAWCWNRGAWWETGWATVGGSSTPPTHWMPLPAAPAKGQ